MEPADLVERYFQCMRKRDLDGLLALFTETAVAVMPDGRQVEGVASLRAMYQHIFSAGAPMPDPQVKLVTREAAAIEVESRLGDGSTRLTANFIHYTPDGLITRLSIYKRGDW